MSTINLIQQFLREIKEYKAIFEAFDVQFDNINYKLDYILRQSSILNADEKRIKEWETFLFITPVGDLYQRKLFIIAMLTSVGKLTSEKINDIVNIYNQGNGCYIEITSTDILIKVRPPFSGYDLPVDDIRRIIVPMKPAQLGLIITLYYNTWGYYFYNNYTWGKVLDLNLWETYLSKTWDYVKTKTIGELLGNNNWHDIKYVEWGA